MLEQSARDFPEDYNPHARLAVAYHAMERWDDALAAADRAVELGYGPRLLGILGTRADILVAKGDTTAARATLVDALARAATLPEGQRSERRIDGLRKKLEALGQS
jgi:predicted negative regulator of RcsB-dependent stress response